MSRVNAPRPLRVLIIEDVQDDADLVVLELRRGGFEPMVERVESAAAMRAALERAPWDVILSDYSVGAFGAPAALEIAKQRGLDVPFIIISGSIEEEAAVVSLRAGAHDFVSKQRLARLVPAIEREILDAENRRNRRRAEEEQWRLSEMLRAVFEASPLGIIELDSEFRVILWNRAAEQIFGWTAEEVIGRVLPIDPEPEHKATRERMMAVLAGQTISNLALRRLRKDGTAIDVLLSAAPIRGQNQEPVGIIALVSDDTQRRLLEAQFQQAQRMEAVGRLAGGIAHDFNNLLTGIKGYAQFVLDGIPSQDPKRADAEEIARIADRAAALTRQLLAFSRKQVIQPRVFNLNTLISDMEKMLVRLIGEDLKFSTVLGAELGNLRADPGQMEQVILNLVVNARDAMPVGGQLTIETENVDLDEEYARMHSGVNAGPHVMLAVSDTGAGIAAEVLPHIFEPFFTTKAAGKGTGLGLSTVFGIVKQNQGHVTVYSEPGVGSTFRVYLPRVDEPVVRIGKVRSDGIRGGSETVLVVEDDDRVRYVAQRALLANGYRVLEADNGAAALQLIAEGHTIDLLITDVVMPEVGGRALAEQLTARIPKLRVLYVSGYTDDAVFRHGLLHSGIHFLEKPFTPEILARVVREVLDSPPGIASPEVS